MCSARSGLAAETSPSRKPKSCCGPGEIFFFSSPCSKKKNRQTHLGVVEKVDPGVAGALHDLGRGEDVDLVAKGDPGAEGEDRDLGGVFFLLCVVGFFFRLSGRGGGGGERGSRSSVVFGLISSPPVAAAADASLSLSFSLHSLPPSILSMATLSLSKLTLRPVRPRRR